MILVLVLGVWILCSGVGFAIGNTKGRGTEGFFWGLLAGIFGLIVIACKRPEKHTSYYGVSLEAELQAKKRRYNPVGTDDPKRTEGKLTGK